MHLDGPNDAADLTGSVIAARDIVELQASVFPWQLDMRQVSTGTMDSRIHIGQVGDLLVTREFWSQKVVATGTTPSGYLALAGTGSEKTFKWCGHEIDSHHVVCGLDSAEVDFATPEREDHWVLLIPRALLEGYIGESAVKALRGQRAMSCGPKLFGRLLSLANRSIDPSRRRSRPNLDRLSTQALRSDLLDATARLVTGDSGNHKPSSPQRRYEVCCRAVAYSKSLRKRISVSELCSAINVKRRTLERAFQETLGITPYHFLYLHRLNHLHKDLLAATPQDKTVTALMLEWGFSELGRTATQFKSLFGESPSDILSQPASSPGIRLADALVGPPRR